MSDATSFEYIKHASGAKLLDFFQSLILYLLINKALAVLSGQHFSFANVSKTVFNDSMSIDHMI